MVSSLCAFWLEHLLYQKVIATLRISFFTTKGTKLTKAEKLAFRVFRGSSHCYSVSIKDATPCWSVIVILPRDKLTNPLFSRSFSSRLITSRLLPSSSATC